MQELLKEFDIMGLLAISLIVTLVVSAITGLFDGYFKKGSHKKWLVAIVALLLTVLNNVWIKGTTQWQEYLMSFVLSWSFAVLFYSYLGLWVVKSFFSKIKARLIK